MSRIPTISVISFACVLSLSACAIDEDDDEGFDEAEPTVTFDDEQMDDELTVEEATLGDELTTSDATVGELFAAPRFQLPFRCDQVWLGETRVGHKPQRAVDFNRTDDFGDRVVAAAAGTVRIVGNEGNDSYGRWIEIGHGNGYTTRYAHLRKQVVKVGQHVKRGQKIGNVGNSGGSDGAHLHYEQRHDGVTMSARFNGKVAKYFGQKNYRSRNCR